MTDNENIGLDINITYFRPLYGNTYASTRSAQNDIEIPKSSLKANNGKTGYFSNQIKSITIFATASCYYKSRIL